MTGEYTKQAIKEQRTPSRKKKNSIDQSQAKTSDFSLLSTTAKPISSSCFLSLSNTPLLCISSFQSKKGSFFYEDSWVCCSSGIEKRTNLEQLFFFLLKSGDRSNVSHFIWEFGSSSSFIFLSVILLISTPKGYFEAIVVGKKRGFFLICQTSFLFLVDR